MAEQHASQGKRPLSLKIAGRQGELDAAEFLAVAEAVRDLGLGRVLLTSGQRLLLPGLDPDQAETLRERLGPLLVQGHDLVQSCPGRGACKFARAETRGMAAELETLIRSLDLPAKVKAGVSGCPHCCAESRVRDLGFIAGARGWTVVFGGNAGKRPRSGDELGRELSDQEALDLARSALEDYARLARPGERTARFQESLNR